MYEAVMLDNCSYIGKFECAVCQGVEAHSDYCVLNCGHPFHVLCVETWLERSATCPSCRAKVSRRQVRPLTGIQSAVDAEGDEGLQQQLAEKHQRVVELQQRLAENQQQVEQLTATVCEMSNRQDRLETKLADAKTRSAMLEAAHREDQQRVCSLTAEKHKLLEKYKTDVALLQHQLEKEQHLRQRQATELRRLQLSNPRLNMSAIHAIASDINEQQSAAALAAVLAERNKQLQDSRTQIEQLQEQLKQQQEAEAKQQEAARVQLEAETARVEQDKQQYMKDALQLEYENSKLKQEHKAILQQMQQLQGVLLVMEGRNTSAAQQTMQQQRQLLQESIQPANSLEQQLKHSKQQQQQASSSKHSTSFSARFTTTAVTAGRRISDDVVDLAVDDDWVPATQHESSPRSSNSQLLNELLDELAGPADFRKPQQEAGQQPTLQPSRKWQCQHANLHQQQQGKHNMTKAGDKVQRPQQVGMVAAFGPGSLLRPGPGLQAPSFIANGKAAQGGGVTGELIRSGPDGRGGTITHLKQGLKRSLPSASAAASSKKLRGGAGALPTGTDFVNSHSKTSQTGITLYFGKRS